MIYLIEYNRQTGMLEDIREFDDADLENAEKARLDVEIERHRAGIRREIVILEASSKDELYKTHRRYFKSIEQLASGS